MKPALIFGIVSIIILAGFLYYSNKTPIEVYTAPEVNVVENKTDIIYYPCFNEDGIEVECKG